MGNFVIHASEFSPNCIIINIETTLELTPDEIRANLRRIGGIRIVALERDKSQWTVTIAHGETNPHPLNARIWKLLEAAYDKGMV